MLVASNLDVVYSGAIRAVRRASLTIEEGAGIGLIGPNGAGKTSLLRAITGFLRLEGAEVNGQLDLDGTSLMGLPPHRLLAHGIVYVPERNKVFTSLSVADNLNLAVTQASRKRRGGSRSEDLLEPVYDLFPVLYERSTQAAGYLSGGEQQMLAIARALMARPTILVLDEPLLGLAPSVSNSVVDALKVIRAGNPLMSVIVAEQNLATIEPIVEKVAVMAAGEIQGTYDMHNATDIRAAISTAVLGTSGGGDD